MLLQNAYDRVNDELRSAKSAISKMQSEKY